MRPWSTIRTGLLTTRGRELARGELLRPEGLRRDRGLVRPVVLVELLVQGEARVARVVLHLHRVQIRECSASTAVSMGI